MKYIQLALVLILFIGCNASKKSRNTDSKTLGYDIEFIDYLFGTTAKSVGRVLQFSILKPFL